MTGIPSGGWALTWYTFAHMSGLWWAGLLLGVTGLILSACHMASIFRHREP